MTVLALATHWNGRGFWFVFADVVLDGFDEVAHGVKDSAADALRVISANQRSTWFRQEALVGVK
jgi:hypothetical protein